MCIDASRVQAIAKLAVAISNCDHSSLALRLTSRFLLQRQRRRNALDGVFPIFIVSGRCGRVFSAGAGHARVQSHAPIAFEL